MDIMQTAKLYLDKRRTGYEYDDEHKVIFIKLTFGEQVAVLKIFAANGLMVFRTDFGFRISPRAARGLLVAMNKTNGRIKFGKFVISAGAINFQTALPLGTDFGEDELVFMQSVSRKAVNEYFEPFLAMSEGSLSLRDYLANYT